MRKILLYFAVGLPVVSAPIALLAWREGGLFANSLGTMDSVLFVLFMPFMAVLIGRYLVLGRNEHGAEKSAGQSLAESIAFRFGKKLKRILGTLRG